MKRIGLVVALLPLLAHAAGQGGKMAIDESTKMAVIGQLYAKYGGGEKQRIELGVEQAARLWRKADGDEKAFLRFCLEHFTPSEKLPALLERFRDKLEKLGGHFNQMTLALRRELDEDTGPLLPVDQIFASYDPSAHLIEDWFANRLAFVVLLNFPATPLEKMLERASGWSTERWAMQRLAQRFLHRVPAEVNQRISEVVTKAGAYIDAYNIRMDRVVDSTGKPMFREGLRLISHWGLRDELRALYAKKDGLAKQRLIYTIMLRIIEQQIPEIVIDNPEVKWDPVANTVDGKPSAREPDKRYAMLLEVKKALQLSDPYYPDAPNPIARAFLLEREMTEERVVGLLERLLQAKVGHDVARLIEKRLGRKLEPFDIWYDGFKARSGLDERRLDAMVRERFPTTDAFQQNLPAILEALGFDRDTARFLAAHIEVDPARGAGHAWGPVMRGGKAHLRTRVPKGGMDYKGFNIAMHELGHTVEQVFSLYRVENTLMAGVPNNAFTEGFAFVFQARDLDVLGAGGADPERDACRTLDAFWSAREIAGVALVDIGVWHWMLEHPDASPAQLREAAVKIATDVWNRHFAPFMGVKDSPILAIYSHMISYPLYLSHYPLGFIVAYQVEDYFRSHPLAENMERMCRQGRLTPDLWMKRAVGSPVSADPMIRGAERAVKSLLKH